MSHQLSKLVKTINPTKVKQQVDRFYDLLNISNFNHFTLIRVDLEKLYQAQPHICCTNKTNYHITCCTPHELCHQRNILRVSLLQQPSNFYILLNLEFLLIVITHKKQSFFIYFCHMNTSSSKQTHIFTRNELIYKIIRKRLIQFISPVITDSLKWANDNIRRVNNIHFLGY